MEKLTFKKVVEDELRSNPNMSDRELEQLWRTRWFEKNWSYVLDIARAWRRKNLNAQPQ